MAKGQHLSGYQQKIVKRYYQNLDTISLTKLAELVSDLAVASTPKASDKLWKRAEEALRRAGVDGNEINELVGAKDTKRLAALVGELWNAANKPATPAKRSSRDM